MTEECSKMSLMSYENLFKILTFFDILNPVVGDCLKYSIGKVVTGMEIGNSEHSCLIIFL